MVRLLADIGGTNVRFALNEAGRPGLQHIAKFRCRDYASLAAAVESYLNSLPRELARPRDACLAVAAAVGGERITMTNVAWSFTRNGLRRDLSLERLEIINDFAAIGWAVPTLATAELHKIGPGATKPDRPAVVIGPGTGLGVSLIVSCDGDYRALQTEGGHVAFAPSDNFEMEILRWMLRRFDRVSVERLLSGPGLAALYESIAAIEGEKIDPLGPAEISKRGTSGECPICKTAMTRFFGILGSVSGDLALATGAEGGIFIAGGIAPQFVRELENSDFRERFESKGRFSDYVSKMATNVVIAPDPGLRGCAVYAARVFD